MKSTQTKFEKVSLKELKKILPEAVLKESTNHRSDKTLVKAEPSKGSKSRPRSKA